MVVAVEDDARLDFFEKLADTMEDRLESEVTH